MTLHVGILGSGNMGAAHARAYAAMQDVKIAAIVGRTPSRVSALASRVGAPALTEPGAVLDDDSIDAIDITLPTGLHREFAVAALKRGKHVFCETPIAATLRDADAMIEAAHESGRLLQVALLMRVAHPGTRVRELVCSGALGRPLSVTTRRLASRRIRAAHHGDAIEELLLLDLDYLNWLFGPPVAIRGMGDVDHVFALLDFRSVKAVAEASCIMPQGFPFTASMTVVCEHGAVETGLRAMPSGPPDVRVTLYAGDKPPEVDSETGPDPYAMECRHFVDSILGRADADLLSATAAREALRVACEVRDSLLLGRPHDD